MSNLQTHCHFKLDLKKKDGPTFRNQMVNPRHQPPQRQSVAKPGYPHVKYPSRESKHDIKESEGNMFNPIFKENIPWWRHQMETVSASLAICAGTSPVSSEFPAQRPVARALMFSLIYARINSWVNNRKAGDLRRHPTHCDVIVMQGQKHPGRSVSAEPELQKVQLWDNRIAIKIPMIMASSNHHDERTLYLGIRKRDT